MVKMSGPSRIPRATASLKFRLQETAQAIHGVVQVRRSVSGVRLAGPQGIQQQVATGTALTLEHQEREKGLHLLRRPSHLSPVPIAQLPVAGKEARDVGSAALGADPLIAQVAAVQTALRPG